MSQRKNEYAPKSEQLSKIHCPRCMSTLVERIHDGNFQDGCYQCKLPGCGTTFIVVEDAKK